MRGVHCPLKDERKTQTQQCNRAPNVRYPSYQHATIQKITLPEERVQLKNTKERREEQKKKPEKNYINPLVFPPGLPLG